jgi:DNA-binding Lrp family transcriptional regulator
VASDGSSQRQGASNRRGSSTPARKVAVEPPRRLRRARADLDAIDVRLIELLAEDGRMSNRGLAAEVGMTEATVAARIKAMFERRVLGVTATLDWRAAGYRWDAWLEVKIGRGSLRDIGHELAAVDGVHALHAVFGPPDLLVHVLLPHSDEAVAFINERIAGVAGVTEVRPNVTLETLKYTTRFARLPVPAQDLHFPDPAVPLDALDHALIATLGVDGRRSNRQIARNLEVSESTVRVRLRRLESEGLLRILGQSDPLLTGAVRAWAFVGLNIEAGEIRSVSERVCAMSEVTIVAITAGRHDMLTLVAARSRSRLAEVIVDEIRCLHGVRSTETWPVVQTLGLEYQRWARLI